MVLCLCQVKKMLLALTLHLQPALRPFGQQHAGLPYGIAGPVPYGQGTVVLFHEPCDADGVHPVVLAPDKPEALLEVQRRYHVQPEPLEAPDTLVERPVVAARVLHAHHDLRTRAVARKEPRDGGGFVLDYR